MEISGGKKSSMSGQRVYRSGNANAKPPGGMAAMRACSACAGDYEDPDRTACTLDGGESEKENENADCSKVDAEEFPAEE